VKGSGEEMMRENDAEDNEVKTRRERPVSNEGVMKGK
jgi:hypothetical protein